MTLLTVKWSIWWCTQCFEIKPIIALWLKNWFTVIKPLMSSRWTDHDLTLSINVRPLRSPWANVSVNGVCQLLDKWEGRGRGAGGVYIPGWRVVFKGLVASTKTLCSAPCLLNRAKLIWVCLELLLASLGRLSPSLPLSFPPQPQWLTVSFKDTLTGHMVVDAHILQWKKCWPLSRRLVCQATWWKPAAIQRTPSRSVWPCLSSHPPSHHHCGS